MQKDQEQGENLAELAEKTRETHRRREDWKRNKTILKMTSKIEKRLKDDQEVDKEGSDPSPPESPHPSKESPRRPMVASLYCLIRSLSPPPSKEMIWR